MTYANSLITAQDAANRAALVRVAAKTYCTKECHDSLQTFQESILSAYGKKEYQLYKNSTTTQSPAVVADSLLAKRTKYYWITAEDENNGFIPEDDLSDNCYSLYKSYCDLGPTDPVPSPSPSAIPTSCTPTSSSASTTDSSPATTTTSSIATPTPTQPNITKDYTKFHKVVNSDNCATISKEYGISQADFLT
ncbi:hypothetical protein CBS147325_7703 [Penicillium roqueforti]|nr:hypothetical protein CBS147325_7703 [Penicillium roqueforti]KAI3154719.1 hypothetical protein DTO046C5_8570 [Penicillium roqueforti]